MSELTLKWGTLKGWNFNDDEAACTLLAEYNELGMSMGAMSQHDTPRQKAIICELIDRCTTPIQNDWSGKEMTKEAAKEYVLDYGKAKTRLAAEPANVISEDQADKKTSEGEQ